MYKYEDSRYINVIQTSISQNEKLFLKYHTDNAQYLSLCLSTTGSETDNVEHKFKAKTRIPKYQARAPQVMVRSKVIR